MLASLFLRAMRRTPSSSVQNVTKRTTTSKMRTTRMVRRFSRVPCSFGLVFSVHPQLANFFSAENHYTADYPEDEVDSDDEFDRHPYMFRNENASDEEEFDNRFFDENDDDEMVLE